MKSNEKCPMKFGEYCYEQGDMTQCYYNVSDKCKQYEPDANALKAHRGGWAKEHPGYYSDFAEWYKENRDRVFWISDAASVMCDPTQWCRPVKIVECIEMPDWDILVGLIDAYGDSNIVFYRRLSNLEFSYVPDEYRYDS